MAAANSSKVVISPYIQAPTTEAGAARTFGGGNETLGGIEMVIGREPTSFNGVIRAVQQSIIKAMKDLQCESIADNIGVFLFDENGNICALQDATTATTFYPIPIRALFIGDKTFGGLEAPDSNAISWSFLPNYSDQLAIVTPTDFNPLTDLVPKYEGYIRREQERVAKFERMESRELPQDIDYNDIRGLRIEAREKLSRLRPENLGRAGRISGVSPADIAVLMIWLENRRYSGGGESNT